MPLISNWSHRFRVERSFPTPKPTRPSTATGFQPPKKHKGTKEAKAVAKMQMYMDMIKEKFAHFDEDKSGSLSPKEWETISLAGQKAAADAQHNQLKRQNNQLKSLFEKADKVCVHVTTG